MLRWVYMDSLRATGHQALDVRCAITSASLNVALNVLLIPRFGMIGAASATVYADVVWFVMSYYYFRRAALASDAFPACVGTAARRRRHVRRAVVHALSGLAVAAGVQSGRVCSCADAVWELATGHRRRARGMNNLISDP